MEKNKDKYPEFIRDIPVGEIVRSITGIQHGSVQILIQDSRVIQIDRTEKKRVSYRAESDYSI
ncbi:MAG TPA: YezD family protein [Dehalococcoidales bacterium]|nr:YezD family protein [Dehalococcoidales bacterium]